MGEGDYGTRSHTAEPYSFLQVWGFFASVRGFYQNNSELLQKVNLVFKDLKCPKEYGAEYIDYLCV